MDEKPCFDLNTNLQKLEALVRMVHGSLESKPKIIDDFNEQHPECTKNNIEKKQMRDNLYKDIDVINKFKNMAKCTYNKVRHI